jgi:hypothetical protein
MFLSKTTLLLVLLLGEIKKHRAIGAFLWFIVDTLIIN